MEDSTPLNEESAGPTSGFIFAAVLLTAIAGVVLFVIEVSMAEDHYRQAHALPDVEVRGFFSNSTEPAPVSMDMLGAKTVLILLAIALVYSILLHPLIGRVVWRVIHTLMEIVDSVYRLEYDEEWSSWDPGVSLVAGAAWPITIFTIPFLLIAIMIGYAYRALWRW